jgi:phosphate transport system substrate-binding protein
MKIIKRISVVGITLCLSLALTACDPPMPEDIKIAQAEKVVRCAEGTGELVVPEAISDLGLGWADSLASSCSNMTLTTVDAPTESSLLVIGDSIAQGQQPAFLNVPFAIDAAVLVVNIPDVFEINLSAPTIIGIFDGSISNWNDAAIVADNDGLELPDLKITLPTMASKAQKVALATWVNSLTGDQLDLSMLKDSTPTDETSLALPEIEGAISIASYSSPLLNGSSFASILTVPAETQTAVLASTETIYAATTQLVAEKTSGIQLKIDSKLKPQAPEGSSEAALPYQAIFTVNLALLGEDSELTRTLARFLLRQDSQGTIASGTMLPTPEFARILAVKEIEKGLPAAADLPTE